jgi:hypothetical protein
MVLMNYIFATIKSRLITIAVSVILFSLFLEVNPAVENKDVLTGTATYGAIWVIYVGYVSGNY